MRNAAGDDSVESIQLLQIFVLIKLLIFDKTSFFWGAIKDELITHQDPWKRVFKESEVDQVGSAEGL